MKRHLHLRPVPLKNERLWATKIYCTGPHYNARTMISGCPVHLLFKNPAIANAFAALLESMNETPLVVRRIADLPDDSRTITEPMYYRSLTPALQQRCLVIGDARAVQDIPTAVIQQPLTPAAVERGIAEFLESTDSL